MAHYFQAGLTYAGVARYRKAVQYSSYAEDMSGITPMGGDGGPTSFEGYIDPSMGAPTYPHDDSSEFVSGRRANDTDLLAG